MKQEKRSWALVADRTAAKIFDCTGKGEIPTVVFEMKNPAGHSRERDLRSDRPGSSMHDRSLRRNSLGPSRSKRGHTTASFIESVVEKLERSKRARRFEELIVIATPRILGTIRESMPPRGALRIKREIRKNMLRIHAGALPRALQKTLTRSLASTARRGM